MNPIPASDPFSLRRPWCHGLLGLFCLLAAVVGCDPTDPEVEPVDVTAATETSFDAVVGEVITVAVQVTDASGAGVSGIVIDWAVTNGDGSTAEGTATTDAEGRASAEWALGTAAGPYTLTASVDGLGSVEFTANASPGSVAEVSVSTSEVTFTALGDTARVAVEALDEYGNPVEGTIAWSSSDESVVTVGADGLLTAIGNGDVTVTAAQAGMEAAVSVHVQQEVASLTVSPESDTLPRHEAAALVVTALDANGHEVEGATPVWSSGAEAVATVDASGVVTAHAMGEVEVTATVGEQAASATLLVAPALTDALSANWQQTCALDVAGQAWCWGTNGDGQLGGGFASELETVPVAVTGGHQFQAIGTGIRATCGLAADGGLHCWGGWLLNQEASNEPRRLDERTYTELTVGLNHACALDAAGDVYCWGDNRAGELGTGTTSDPVALPTRASTSEPMVEIRAGAGHVCAIGESGDTYCWGRGTSGELGNGAAASASTPQAVSTEVEFTRLALGTVHSCALTAEGQMYCWGANNGAFGDGAETSSLFPVPVAGELRFRNADGGPWSTCATTDGGVGYCWGRTEDGQLGVEPGGALLEPVEVGSFAYLSIALQGSHSCGIESDGGVACAGARTSLGDGDLPIAPPGPVLEPEPFVSVESGTSHSCGITADGSAWCWGDGRRGSLGNGAFQSSAEPVLVAGGHAFSDLSLGDDYTCGVTTDGTAFCWGVNSYGQLGSGGGDSRYGTPQAVASGDLVFETIATSYYTTCALTSAGDPYCWGYNGFYGYGNGDQTSSAVPVPAASGLSLTDITLGRNHACGIAQDGTGYCWGIGTAGQIGDGTTQIRSTPVAVTGGYSWASVDASYRSTCGLTTDGDGYCWGGNGYGQLGVGDTDNRNVPTAVAGGGSFTSIELHEYVTCAITTDAALHCWGHDGVGQATTTPNFEDPRRLTPHHIATLTGVISAAPAAVHVCAVADAGTHCWGSQSEGRLGDGEFAYRASFGPVSGNLSVSADGHARTSVRGLYRGVRLPVGVRRGHNSVGSHHALPEGAAQDPMSADPPVRQ